MIIKLICNEVPSNQTQRGFVQYMGYYEIESKQIDDISFESQDNLILSFPNNVSKKYIYESFIAKILFCKFRFMSHMFNDRIVNLYVPENIVDLVSLKLDELLDITLNIKRYNDKFERGFLRNSKGALQYVVKTKGEEHQKFYRILS